MVILRKYSVGNSMVTVSRILVPYDGTEMSDKSLNKAAEYAKAQL